MHTSQIFRTFAARIKISTKNNRIMKKIIALCISAICALQLMATQLIITPRSGADMAQDIAVIGKWVFVDNNLQLLDKAGTILATEPIANIRKITFGEGTTTDVEHIQNADIRIYPNPTQDILIISGIEAQPLRVYDLQGKVVLQEHGTQVQVSNLTNGTYLLQIGTQVVRFIKN